MSVKAVTWQWSNTWPNCLIPVGFPTNIRACITSRRAFLSEHKNSNFSLYTNDTPEHVHTRRHQLSEALGIPIYWFSRQVHGTRVANLSFSGKEACIPYNAALPTEYEVTEPGDAQWTDQPDLGLSVLTADCLPVLFSNRAGTVVAAAHAGWRGLQAGVLENTIHALPAPAHDLIAWIGPAIGPSAFQVGNDVRDAFCDSQPVLHTAFIPDPANADKWYANLSFLAQHRLRQIGVTQIIASELCTYQDSEDWFSYRCDQKAGRFASLIWIEKNPLIATL